MKKAVYWRLIYFTAAVVVTFIAVATGNFFAKKLSLQVGQIAKETIYAPFQVENEMATNRKKELAEKNVLPAYKIDIKEQERAISSIETFYAHVLAVKTTDTAEKLKKTPIEALRAASSIALYNEEYQTLLSASADDLNQMEEACIYIASVLFEKGIKAADINKILEIRSMLQETDLSATYKKLCESIVSDSLRPNVVLDEVATEEARKLEREKVDPVFILQGETIIEKGTRVTEEIYNLLDKVGYLDNNQTEKFKHYLGIGLMILLIFTFVFRYAVKNHTAKVLQDKQIILMLILYILSVSITRLLLGKAFVFLPLAVMPMLIVLLINIETAVISNMVLVLVAALIAKGDSLFVFYFTITGILSALIIAQMQERKKTMISAVTVGSMQLITYLALRLFTGADIGFALIPEAAVAFGLGIISVVVVVGMMPLFESAFGFVTPLQLLELTNPNQPVLKRLLLEATGTYYHSLLVANLAETAADAIGANPLMARVGGYYHDIGKIVRSDYYKENQTLDNPHDNLDPIKSFQIVASHVSAGIRLAAEYHLPFYIKDIISEHHGTSLMQFFYVKAKEQKGPFIKEEQFRYPGPKPRTKEAALVMLADVVEATVRSMQDKLGSETTIEQLVTKMVKLKLKEGQLDECELYISDIDKIIDSFTKMLKGMYHVRIQYPERNDR